MPQKQRSRINYYFHKYFIIPLMIFRISVLDTIRQDGIEHAGYLAFLSIFSLFPFLIFLISIVGFFGASEMGAQIVHTILSAAPREMAEALAPRINEIISGPPQSFLTIAIIGVIWTASSSVEGCRTILNRAYRIAFPPPYLWRRFISILEFFVIIFSIVIGIIIFIIVPTFLKEVEGAFSLHLNFDYDFFYLRQLAIFVVLTSATSLLYYALPNAKQKITQTVPGSIVVVLLWVSLERGFSLYLENFHQFNFVYGSLAGMIVSLMFFYLISLAFIFGAEFNYHFHRTYQVFLKDRK
ncbi:MAG: YihY/virulence factor BrkB family protein [Pseudomonadota bacterium]